MVSITLLKKKYSTGNSMWCDFCCIMSFTYIHIMLAIKTCQKNKKPQIYKNLGIGLDLSQSL